MHTFCQETENKRTNDNMNEILSTCSYLHIIFFVRAFVVVFIVLFICLLLQNVFPVKSANVLHRQ